MPRKLVERALSKVVAVEGLLAGEVSRSPEYSFSSDWFSHVIPLWSRHLEAFKGRANVSVLEIGNYEGRSAIWLLDNVLTHPTSSITCVDLFTSRLAEIRFEHNTKFSGSSDRITKIKGRSQEVLKLFRECSYDIVYIDGSHRAADVHVDALLSWDLLKPGGIMIFDDYGWEPQKPPEDRPEKAIDAFLNEFGPRIEILHKGYQVIVRRKDPALRAADARSGSSSTPEEAGRR